MVVVYALQKTELLCLIHAQRSILLKQVCLLLCAAALVVWKAAAIHVQQMFSQQHSRNAQTISTKDEDSCFAQACWVHVVQCIGTPCPA
jgi:hypothetical protein